MMPSLDVLTGKHIDWDSFSTNPEFYQKNFDLRYGRAGVVIMKRKQTEKQHRRQ